MPESTPLTIGAKANCSDGVCGRLTQVVIDPLDDEITHVIVEPEHRVGLGRLVPVGWVQPARDGISLRCSRAEFEELPGAEQTRFLPGSEGHPSYTPDQMLLWPYFGGNTTPPTTVDTLPVGEVAVRRGEEVFATDGRIGEVEGLIVDRGNHRATHVLLKEGHLIGRSKEVAIPISAVAGVDAGGIRLSVSVTDVGELPAVDFVHRADSRSKRGSREERSGQR